MNVGSRLKQQRINLGLEIKDVAKMLGKSYQYVRQIEEGINNPPAWALLRKFAEIYECSIDDLFGLKTDKDTDVEIEEEVREFIATIRKLPSHRRRDLFAMAEMFKNQKETEDSIALTTLLNRIEANAGKDARLLLLEYLRRLLNGRDFDLPLEDGV